MKTVQRLAAAAAAGTFCILVVGRIVVITRASESIPDWPLAHGALIPKMTWLVFAEWFHRLLVFLVMLNMLGLVAAAWRQSRRLGIYCTSSLGVMLLTAVLGGLSILYPVPLIIPVLDQVFAILFFASLVALAVWSRMAPAAGSPDRKGSSVDRAGARLPAQEIGTRL